MGEHHSHTDSDVDSSHAHGASEAVAPTSPSRGVVISVDDTHGALVISAAVGDVGTEIEIFPRKDPTARTHVWVLAREGRDAITYAAVFPRVATGEYAILGSDGSIQHVLWVPPNEVTFTSWLGPTTNT